VERFAGHVLDLFTDGNDGSAAVQNLTAAVFVPKGFQQIVAALKLSEHEFDFFAWCLSHEWNG
jgi:hypothetical protein